VTVWDKVKAERGLSFATLREEHAALVSWLDEPHPEWTEEQRAGYHRLGFWIRPVKDIFPELPPVGTPAPE
jgi:hypothetical protein